MNRRDFRGSVIAGAAARQFAGPGKTTVAGVAGALPRPQWLENGLIDAWGSRERKCHGATRVTTPQNL